MPRHGLCIVAIYLLLAVGCGKKLDASLSGVVTLDGKPLHTGLVTFTPVKSGAAAYADIGADGRYSARTGNNAGLACGDYVVTVVALTRPPRGRDDLPGDLLTPTRYSNPRQSDLHFTIGPGANRIDIHLHTQRKGGRPPTL
jgi:hypothetical protein